MKAVRTTSVGTISIHQASRRCVLPKRVKPPTVEDSATLFMHPPNRVEYSRTPLLQTGFCATTRRTRRKKSQSRSTVAGEKADRQTEVYSAPSGVEYRTHSPRRVITACNSPVLCAARSVPLNTMLHSSNSGVCPGSDHPRGTSHARDANARGL